MPGASGKVVAARDVGAAARDPRREPSGRDSSAVLCASSGGSTRQGSRRRARVESPQDLRSHALAVSWRLRAWLTALGSSGVRT